jgi:DNA-binding response OmpR family regulator
LIRTAEIYSHGKLTINFYLLRVWSGGIEIPMSVMELRLLSILSADPRRVFTTSDLVHRLITSETAVRAIICRTQKKLNQEFILSVRDGYCMESGNGAKES